MLEIVQKDSIYLETYFYCFYGFQLQDKYEKLKTLVVFVFYISSEVEDQKNSRQRPFLYQKH